MRCSHSGGPILHAAERARNDRFRQHFVSDGHQDPGRPEMKFALALCPALLLAAPALPAPALAAPGEAPYHAAGTEPGWTLTIDRGLIRYVGDYGKTRVTTAAPEAR